MTEVSLFIARVHPRVGRIGSLVLTAYPQDEAKVVEVLVNSRLREFKSYSDGLYLKLRISLYCWDNGAMVELRNAVLCKRGYPTKKTMLRGPSNFVLVLPERTFQLFKILEKAKLLGVQQTSGHSVDPNTVARKYSIAKLPFTERFLRETGYLNRVNVRYGAILRKSLANGKGRMPRKLAEEALIEACNREVPPFVADLVVRKYRLKRPEMSSLLVLAELEGWRRLDGVS